MKSIKVINKDDCCGCTACSAICPKRAISMHTDDKGFIYPKIDDSLCIDCGLCLSVCREKQTQDRVVASYAAKNINKEVLRKSSSGGVSNGLAKKMILDGGVVYGVVYDDNFNVITKRLDTLNSLEELYGSKYVQTNPLNTMKEVYNDLCNGLKVLFFGTSCHVSGLISYLSSCKINMSNLVTVDLICHGVPSPIVFADYIKWLNKRGSLIKFEFRTKNKPWGYGSKNFGCTAHYASKVGCDNQKTEIDTLKTRVFLKLFFSNNCLRPHCYKCPYIGNNKSSDITIADYWGCQEQEPNFFTEEGVSAVICHTDKGNAFLHSVEDIKTKESSIKKISVKQGMMHDACKIPDTYEQFWKDYHNKGFVYIAKKYGGYSFKSRIKRKLFSIIK